MSTVDDYIKQNAELHQFAAEVARIISGIPSMRILSFVTETMEMTQLLLLIYTALHIQAINFLKAYVLIQFGKKCKRSVVT